MNEPTGNIVIVSNRLPVRITQTGKKPQLIPGSGGLVTAMAPVLRNRGGKWIGWDGDKSGKSHKKLFKKETTGIGYSLIPISLTPQEVEQYYEGFSNATLWPLFHDFLDRSQFQPENWHTYCSVNRKFARTVAENSDEDDLIWVHDYHLLLVGKYLAELGVKRKTSLFIHIPFPPWDLFMRLPWGKEIIAGILSHDLVGFQTERDRWNFVRCLRRLFPCAIVSGPQRNQLIEHDGKITRIGAFPISIDFEGFDQLASSKEVADEAWYIHERMPGRKLVLGVDRLDYTKGILERLKAFEILLEKHSDLRDKINFIQVVVPSRVDVKEYQEMKCTIDETVGRINGRFTYHDWVPIYYIYRALSRTELVAYYRTSEIALITPLKDGMNLVAKEYCASSVETDGVLILSEFAGAAPQLGKSSLLVNPFNVEAVADKIYMAFHMPEGERKSRMRRLRAEVRRNNIFRWVEHFLSEVGSPLPKPHTTTDNSPLARRTGRKHTSSKKHKTPYPEGGSIDNKT
ncbi:MAG: trehalose-6-phosphate synthase [Deltaproteobacteria bacterium]|nr:trehalose-6-phosphate synthase [Deltaproteobacteria bacterium]